MRLRGPSTSVMGKNGNLYLLGLLGAAGIVAVVLVLFWRSSFSDEWRVLCLDSGLI